MFNAKKMVATAVIVSFPSIPDDVALASDASLLAA